MATASSNQEKARIAGLYSLLQVDPNDPYRIYWNKSLGRKGRQLIAAFSALDSFYADRKWDELAPDTRGRIRNTLAEMKKWLEKLPDDPQRNGEAH